MPFRQRLRRPALPLLGAACVALAGSCIHRPGAGTVGGALLAAAAPEGADTIGGVSWLHVPVPSGGTLTAAIARPAAPGPHPVLVILHGTHGFAREYVALARDLARYSGVIAVTACWFTGGRGAGAQFVHPIACPDAPPLPTTGATPEAQAAVGALMDAARALPGGRADRVVLVGHSRGAVAALTYALGPGGRSHEPPPGLRALVLNSGAYPPEYVARAAGLRVPTLLLHGTADHPADGGSELTAIVRAQAFAAALTAAGRVVEVEFTEGARHGALLTDPAHRARSIRRVTDFLNAHGIR